MGTSVLSPPRHVLIIHTARRFDSADNNLNTETDDLEHGLISP